MRVTCDTIPLEPVRAAGASSRDISGARGTMRNLLVGLACAMASGLVADAAAQTYPSRQITMIVPFPAGGATDTFARLLAEQLRATFRQAVIVENVAGAGGTIGVGRAARAAGDGYTLSIGTVS